ncbi:nuclear transport factor 2 family protein [Planotetraspora sp. GP83]|uniref:nuclear transport factor 2 family protein n=1 Tax=Planotetraspora sp. GP83 TaxID=3156264 RepID=UPI0035135284
MRARPEPEHPGERPGRYFAEYRSTGTVAASGYEYRQAYTAYLEVRDGLVTIWREYFNPLPLREALASAGA